MERLVHPIAPLYDAESRILILGTFPSPKSREARFFYGHPQNIFWQVLPRVLGSDAVLQSVAERAEFAHAHHVALWDVIAEVEIKGADDASIRMIRANRFRPMLEGSKIRAIFTTGKKATELFNRHCASEAGMHSIYLPSTSPANRAQQGRPEFFELWSQVRAELEVRDVQGDVHLRKGLDEG